VNHIDHELEHVKPIPAPRKPYTKPRLTYYGHVKDIVQGGLGTGNDGGAAGHSKVCWIAEALYGVNTPRTLLVRGWLTEAYDQKRRWWFLVSLYRTFGRPVAGLIRRGGVLAQLLIPVFDYLVVKANDDTARVLKQRRRALPLQD